MDIETETTIDRVALRIDDLYAMIEKLRHRINMLEGDLNHAKEVLSTLENKINSVECRR